MVEKNTIFTMGQGDNKIFVKFECQECHQVFCVTVKEGQQPTCAGATCDSKSFIILDQIEYRI